MPSFKNQINDVIAIPADKQKDTAAFVQQLSSKKKEEQFSSLVKKIDLSSLAETEKASPKASSHFQDKILAERSKTPDGKGSGRG